MQVLERPTRYLFFTGKGGVGKTSLASATAVALADAGKRVLLVSTDPASNLEHVFDIQVGTAAAPVAAVPGLWVMNIDPETAAESYRARALDQIRANATAQELAGLEEQLSGACTVEIAAFDRFTGVLLGKHGASDFDHIVFDTAPTGHTLRLLKLPAAWSSFMDANPRGASCLGPSSALDQQQSQYATAVEALGDAALTTMVIVARPERGALREAARTASELGEQGLKNQHLVINGDFVAIHRSDRVSVGFEKRGQDALADMPSVLNGLTRTQVPLKPFNMVGVEALREMLADQDPGKSESLPRAGTGELALPLLNELIDSLLAEGPGVIMVMGKGGVGKTTIASSIAVGLAHRGAPVVLTTTVPAAHLAETLEQGSLSILVERIDPEDETRAYVERVLKVRGAGMSHAELALLEEDLASPCSEEVAVFHAFSRVIGRGRKEYVVIDTAPTGHTLLLLDTTGAYHHEILRSMGEGSGVGKAVTPLMRLRDPEFTRMLVVTLPESTPVREATDLQTDLRRAGIEPYGWVINGSLLAAGTTDPLLAARASEERPLIEIVRNELAEKIALVPWLIEEPVGEDQLLALAGTSSRAIPELVEI